MTTPPPGRWRRTTPGDNPPPYLPPSPGAPSMQPQWSSPTWAGPESGTGTVAGPPPSGPRIPGHLLGGAVAIVIVIVLAVAGVVYLVDRNNSSSSDFTLSDSEIRDLFDDNGALKDCTALTTVLEPAGITALYHDDDQDECVADSTDSSGTTDTGEVNTAPETMSEMLDDISEEAAGNPRSQVVKSSDPHLPDWIEYTDENRGDPEYNSFCAMGYEYSPGNSVAISVGGVDACGKLYPAARQLQNLFDRKEWLDSGDGKEPTLIPLHDSE